MKATIGHSSWKTAK